MGLFDSVYFRCPGCDTELGVQSKAGDCVLVSYHQGSVPATIADDIRGETIWCPRCRSSWTVRTKVVPSLEEMELA